MTTATLTRPQTATIPDLGAMKSRLIAGDLEGAREDARWALEAGAAASGRPNGPDAAARAADGTDPTDDLNATAEYGRHLAQVPTRRALEDAGA